MFFILPDFSHKQDYNITSLRETELKTHIHLQQEGASTM